ncbi:FG-GAP-like repeat-containing protein [Botrimarina hoheduenensis]|uniref:FG-GAP repeat protein n=1 Tax=Botrimarina hoheduenensis TaxID=2528000 RepID=A0A5C5VS25_9BACT|nr:FG-GAP-like repeat-containing protein [Botrimarina hoheduenensis]TWT41436.1 FG-GAP repeat protein [Botrimarina hoheduenensis]
MFDHRFLRLFSIALVVGMASQATAFFTNVGGLLLNRNLDARSASLADIDNDNDLDLLFQGGVGAQLLFRNNLSSSGVPTFTEVADWTAIGVTAGSWSAAWADIDNDGFVDAFVGQSNIGQTGDVLINNGAGSFLNRSGSLGLNDPGFHQNVAWADMDRNGRLDLVIAMEGPEPHEIYLQGATGTFTPVGAAAGFQNLPAEKAYGMAIGDTDGDGDLDIYISTCRPNNNIRNFFYENQLAQTGTLSFIDIADTNGTQFFQNSYGTEFHDFDDDGDLDLFMIGADSQLSKIWRNDGGNQFTDTDLLTGTPLLADVSGDLNGGKAVDYDNDGDLDLFFHDHKPLNGRNNARKLYRNDGNWQFTDVTAAEGLQEVNRGSYDSPWGDIDRDGDQDLIATTDSGTPERIYLSDESTNGNHWLYVELEGAAFNTTGLGATLYATINEGTPQERTIRREANTNAGTFNQSDLPVHFGLGTASLIDELRIVWTDGMTQVLADVALDQYLSVAYADRLVGDFNGDGTVDVADYTVWRDAEGTQEIGNAADANGDGLVNADDYSAWAANFGATSAGGSSIPEPTTQLLIMLMMAAFGGVRRR